MKPHRLLGGRAFVAENLTGCPTGRPASVNRDRRYARIWFQLLIIVLTIFCEKAQSQDETILLMKKLYRQHMYVRFNSTAGAFRQRKENNVTLANSAARFLYQILVDEKERNSKSDLVYHRLFAVTKILEAPTLTTKKWDEGLSLIGTLLPNERIAEFRPAKNQFTIFAPTNAAVYKERQLLTRLDDREEYDKLTNIVNFHVTKGKISVDQFRKVNQLDSLNGMSLKLTMKSDDFYVEDAKIIKSIESHAWSPSGM